MQEASGGSIWRRHHRRRHLRYLEGIWKHLDASGGIWEASGDMEAFGRQLRGMGNHLGGIWEASETSGSLGEASGDIKEAPGDTKSHQETPRKHPGGTQEAPRKHPGGSQEAPKGTQRHPGGTQEGPLGLINYDST